MCVNSEDEEEAMCQDTDSDVADQKDCGKVKVKWTQEEVCCYKQSHCSGGLSLKPYIVGICLKFYRNEDLCIGYHWKSISFHVFSNSHVM